MIKATAMTTRTSEEALVRASIHHPNLLVNDMKYAKYLMLAVPLLWVGACTDDDGITDLGPQPPAATIRFLNAVPDTGVVDLRFVDKVENLPMLQGIALGASSGLFQRTEPGARKARVFPNSTNIAVTSIMLVDTTVNLAANTRYTLVYAGRAAGNQDRLAVINEDVPPPSPASGSIAIRVLHVAHGATGPFGNVDVYIVPVTSATAATPADWQTSRVALISNVTYFGKSAYATMPVRPSTTGMLYRFVVTAAGTTNVLYAFTPNQPGIQQVTGATYGPQPGMQVSGSVLTAALVGGSIPGTKESTSANQVPTVTIMPDKVLDPS